MLPLDTLGLLEEQRGMPVLVDRKSRLDWEGLRGKIRQQGMRNSNCLAIAPDRDHLEHHGLHPLHRAELQAYPHQVEPLGRVRPDERFSGQGADAARLWDEEMLSDLKYFDGSIQAIERVPEEIRKLYKTAFEIEPTWLLQCAAVRQKWIDQSQSVNLFLAENDARQASFIYREAWERGLKTTYYLRTINKSSMDSSNRDPPQGRAPPRRLRRRPPPARSRRCATARSANRASNL